MDSRPIGVFDSGVGGLSLLQELRRQLPHETIHYYADTLHWPYGVRSPEEIRRLAGDAVALLAADDAKLIVVACNSATTNAINHLRQVYDLPFVGMEPAVKPAAGLSHSSTIAVLATSITLSAPPYQRLIEQFAAGCSVYSEAVPGLVRAVERGEVGRDELEPLLQPILARLVANGVDTIVLGCTHFPFARSVIEELAGPAVTVIDSGEAVVRQCAWLLETRGLAADPAGQGSTRFLCSGDYNRFMNVVARLVPALFDEWLGSRWARGTGLAAAKA